MTIKCLWDLQYLLVSTVLVSKFNHIFNYTHQLREIGIVSMTYFQIRSWCAYIGPRNASEGKTRVRKSTLKTWNSDLFCNSAMELILLILKMASGYLLATFLHEKCTANRSRTMFIWWCACANVAFLYLNSYCVYTSLYMHALPCPCTYKLK